MDAIDIARARYEANRAYQLALGEEPSPHWEAAPQWLKDSALQGVRYRIDHPRATSSDMHEQWMRKRLSRGWTLGPVKDESAKTHPNLVPYDQLPAEQRRKDLLFSTIVTAMILSDTLKLVPVLKDDGPVAANPMTQFLAGKQSVVDEVPPQPLNASRSVEYDDGAQPPSYPAPPAAGKTKKGKE